MVFADYCLVLSSVGPDCFIIFWKYLCLFIPEKNSILKFYLIYGLGLILLCRVEFVDVHRLSDGQVKHSAEVFYAGSLWKVDHSHPFLSLPNLDVLLCFLNVLMQNGIYDNSPIYR